MRRRVAVAAVAAAAVAGSLTARSQDPKPLPAASASEPKATPAKLEPLGEDRRVKADAIDEVMADGKLFLLDVRERREIEEKGGYEGYVNIPLGQLESRLGELPRDRPILTA